MDSENETAARFAAIVEALARMPGVMHGKSGRRLFGSSALKVHDKSFAMVSTLSLGRGPQRRVRSVPPLAPTDLAFEIPELGSA